MMNISNRLKMRRTKQYRNIKQQCIFAGFTIVSLVAIAINVYQFNTIVQHNQHSNNNINTFGNFGRHILGYEIPNANYPEDVFTEDQLESGALVLHVLGLFYMFLAIAIVCDEFFVPAIEVIVDRLAMSPDTAGATFMAAGGSAPELFTSFFGTFVSKSDVGFGTIVGSAVFNVLFVIGCCAVFSSGDLVLTWYPFARDCIYYCIGLCTLAGFFYDFTIEWYEATILFAMYLGYVTLMINNRKVYEFMDRTVIKTPERKRAATADQQLRPLQPIQTFSVSLFKMMTKDAQISDIAGLHIVARMKGDIRATFRQVDANNDQVIDKEELRGVLQKLEGTVTDEEVDRCYKQLDEDDNGEIDFQEFSRWYLRSENRLQSDVKQIFTRYDRDDSGFIDISELEAIVVACQGGSMEDSKPSTEEIENARKILDANNDGKISQDEFLEWYKSSVFFEKEQLRRNTIVEEAEKEEEDGIDLTFPEGMRGRILYIVGAPIMYSLYFTVPDVRKPKWENWYFVAFINSIIWLGVYSYMMVWWATVLGKIVGIPDGVMGLTLLAAGTSVPDLISSVLVAKAGHGDMAVSSSIGSNIFDILVGLPLPWLIACIAWGGSIEVQADSLFLSIIILFGMLAAVLAIIWYSKWRMTRTLGYSMFVLYVIFVIQDVCRQYLV